MIQYDTVAYAISRLVGTFVLLNNGVPVEVLHIRNVDWSVHVKELSYPNKEYFVDIKELNLVTPPLGYCESEGGYVYICRKPMRRDWRQGLRWNSIRVLGGAEIGRDQLSACMKGEYPTFKECIGDMYDRPMAWHRDFAVHEGALLYRSLVVGDVNEAGAVTLHTDFEFLWEVLNESYS